jgi:hypothetical protein
MHSPNGSRARRGILMTAALGAVAILALSGLALAHGRGDDHRHGGPDTGTIASFDSETGVLAIQLTGGDTVSGLVTRRTKIKCEDEHSSDSRVRGRESEPGDDRGGHGNEPGDDNGGRGHEPGDDNSGSGSGPSGHDDNGTGANCTSADLVAGAVVHEAELDLRNGKALFHEVELAE